MQSKAATVKEYLASLPEDRRAAVSAVRETILKNLDAGYEEGMSYGMIGYFVPHSRYPAGYHCNPEQPLPFAGLASQKQHLSLYLMGVYCGCPDGQGMTEQGRWFRDAWAKTGKKLDMGKACVRFKTLDDLPLDVVGEAIRRVPASLYIRQYEASLAAMGKAPGKPPAKTAPKPPTKPAAKAAPKPAKKAVKKAAKKSSGKKKP